MKRDRPSKTSLPSRARIFTRWSQWILTLGGLIAIGYVGLVIADAKLFQVYQAWRFQQTLRKGVGPEDRTERSALNQPKVTDGETSNTFVILPEGHPLGQLQIAAIGLDVMMLEGIQDQTLRRAAGHIPGTALPWQPGNFAIAGHRDTFFRYLRHIKNGDSITLNTEKGLYRYQVSSTRVVMPDDVQVLDDTGEDTLTLVTCYPFNFVGSAPQRFIVSARKVPGTAQRNVRAADHSSQNSH